MMSIDDPSMSSGCATPEERHRHRREEPWAGSCSGKDGEDFSVDAPHDEKAITVYHPGQGRAKWPIGEQVAASWRRILKLGGPHAARLSRTARRGVRRQRAGDAHRSGESRPTSCRQLTETRLAPRGPRHRSQDLMRIACYPPAVPLRISHLALRTCSVSLRLRGTSSIPQPEPPGGSPTGRIRRRDPASAARGAP